MRGSGRTAGMILALFLIVGSVVACGGEANSSTPLAPAATPTEGGQEPAETDAVPFTTVAQDAPLGDEPVEPTYAVVGTDEGWDPLAAQLPDELVEAGRAADPEQVFVTAFAGAKASSGYRMTVTSIHSQGEQLLVTVEEETPGVYENVESAMTLPFHLVAIAAEDVPDGVTTVLFQRENGETVAEHPYPLP